MVNIAAIKQLREMTGAGPLDSKNALVENDGDVEKAAEWLREKGIAKAVKKLGKGRSMAEGLIEMYRHHDGTMGVIVEVNCETDFVAKNELFQRFAKDIALHISSEKPQYITREEVPEDVVNEEKEQLLKMDDLDGKPDNIKEKIVEGRMDKFFQQIVLMEQEFLKDDSKTIQELLEETVAEIGESIQISRFARFEIAGATFDEDDE